MEEDKNQRLENIENLLKEIHKVLKPTRLQLFFQGLWRAAGYLVGLILAIAILGWLLNVLGLIPSFTNLSENLQEILDVVKSK